MPGRAYGGAATGLAFALVGALGECRLPETLELVASRDPRIVYVGDPESSAVALTIDDGPDPGTTPRLLEVLAAHEARATFFLLGERVAGREALAEAILAGGHEIANHLMYDRPAIELSPAHFEAELPRSHEVLRTFGAVRWFRPGSGWYEDWMFPILERHGYQMALGTVYALDTVIPWVWLTHRLARWQVDPGDVLILHDGPERGGRSARLLERLLPELSKRRLRVVTLSELMDGPVRNGPRADAQSPR